MRETSNSIGTHKDSIRYRYHQKHTIFHMNMNVLLCTLRFSEPEKDQEREEFTEEANVVIEQLKSMGFEEALIRAAISSAKSLDVQIHVEIITRKGK